MNRRLWWAWVGVGARPGRPVHPALVAAVIAAAVGVAGLWYGSGPTQSGGAASSAAASGGSGAGGGSGPAGNGPAGGTATVGDITVRGGYLRQPASPDAAAAYLSITNSGSQPDTLLSAYCGAARDTTLHDVPGAAGTTALSGSPSGAGSGPARHVPSGPVTIAAGSTLTLSPGHGHVMLDGLTGQLRPGDNVSLLLSFQRTGQVLVELPVIAIGAPAPDGGRR